ncbi:MAG: sigma-70 family RNA polymerase sigma factor [Brevefilum sp.]|nr:sigma-70 family RNA polymerase sigma factor [Brevefilum sp.]
MEMDIYIEEVNQRQLTKKDLVEIYEQFSPRLFAYAFRLLGDSQLAEDCVSETFSRFLKVIQRGVGPNDNLKAYLYRISHNWIMDHYRNRIPEQDDVEIGNLQSSSGNPEAMVSQASERRKVREALLELPENQRQVIMLRFYEDWSHSEAASALGKSEQATRALQYRALEGLRNKLLSDQRQGKA